MIMTPPQQLVAVNWTGCDFHRERLFLQERLPLKTHRDKEGLTL